MTAQHQNCNATAELYVVQCPGPSLCGRDVIQKLHLLPDQEVGTILTPDCEMSSVTEQLKEKFKDLFGLGTGLMKGPPASIAMKKDATPRFLKARSLPYSLREKVGMELDRMCQQGILSPVSHSCWATPIVPVVKADGTLRICGDLKVTVNPECDVDQYPLPKMGDIFASLKGGYWFSKLDLREAYCHIPLDDQAKQVAVLNTHKGLFAHNRLPYGIASAPAIFQRKMEELLKNVPGTQVFLDDVLIAEDKNSYGKTVNKVLEIFRENGIRLRKDKCVFGAQEVTYLGHKIDRHGLHPAEKKLDTIVRAPAPRNVQELRSFLGLITYYRSFLLNMSSLLAPLYRLLQKESKWKWASEEKRAFEAVKNSLINSDMLVHFDPTKELVLECDASPEGIGAVLSHVIDGIERPIAFRSRTLTKTEKNYSQLEREALALVFAVVKFRDYLLCREFTLKTDREPLVGLFKENRPIPTTAASRIQRRTPSGSRDKSPAEMLLSYRPKGRLDLLLQKPQEPNVERHTLTKEKWVRGQTVLFRNFGLGQCWMKGTVQQVLGNRMLKLNTAGGPVTQHFDQVRRCDNGSPTEHSEWWDLHEQQSSSAPTPAAEGQPGRPTRIRRPPNRLNL
ncbi:hypothetical protein V5799_015611 [Amblyomma americanum]|uniref:Reverse transcriptase domain-containing protein n=1 Tax=Amblyomma americanum TaxID=6943 RepID=A0AAQ4F8U3_AMBAM